MRHVILTISFSCLSFGQGTQVDFLSQVKNKNAYTVTQNSGVTNGGYLQFSPVTYNPYDSGSTCLDAYSNPVQQPLPANKQPAFGPHDIVMWNSLSPSMPFQSGTGSGLVQKVLVTSPSSTNTGPCGQPLAVETDFGLNINSYFFARGGVATDLPEYNSIQSLQGGMTANSYTAGVLYPAGTTVCTGMSGATCTGTTVLGAPAYLGGHVDTGHSSGPPQGTTIQASTNPFSGGEGNVAGQIYYDDALQCERVYSGSTWGCIGGAPSGPTNSIQTNQSGTSVGYSTLVYDHVANVVTLTGSGAQGFVAPLFDCTSTGTTACAQQASGTWVINGQGDFRGQSLTTGANNGTTATAGAGAVVNKAGATISMLLYDSAGVCGIGTGETSPGIVCTSDQRLKTPGVTIGDGLDKVMALRPVSFNWLNSGKPGIGFIAQEVQKVIPQIVTKAPESDYLMLSEGGIIPYLVRAVQQQQAEIEALKAQILRSNSLSNTTLAAQR